MAMMAKMRSLAPAFIITVGALFVLFMVISDSNVLEALGGRTNNIGTIDGRDITIDEYRLALDRQIENERARTGGDLNETQMDQIREQVWDALVTQILFEQKIDEYDISVSDEEIRDIILGEEPPQFLKQNFVDSTGNFNRQLYEQALFDPQNREALIQAEELVRQSRLTEKLQSIILASVNVSEDEVKRRYIDQMTEINVKYALADINTIPDSAVTVTDEDLRDYYEENLDKYRIKTQRKLNYVLFPNTASAEDSASILRNLETIKSKFATDSIEFKEYVDIYSTAPYSLDTIDITGLSPEAIDRLNSASEGEVIGPVISQQGYSLFYLNNKFQSDKPTARASHILINQYGDDEKNHEEANKIYNRLIGGESFETLAKEYSQDPGSGSRGGDLGWFGKGVMVPEFESAVFSGKVGEVLKPVKTNFGYHIIKVTGRTNLKFVVESIIIPIKQSEATRDKRFNEASDFAYLAQKNDFKQEAELLNYNVQETPVFQEGIQNVPGIGPNPRLVIFAFENSVGTVSEPYKIPNGYVVVEIAEAKGEHVTPFEEVKEQIKPFVIREEKLEVAEKIINNVQKKINGNLDKAVEINSQIRVQETGKFKPGTSVPGIGRDYAFISKALELPVNQVSDPVEGQRGYYLMKVLFRTPFDSSAYSLQSSTLRAQLLQEKKTQFLNQWVEELKANADIEDNRNIFYTM